MHVLVVDPSPVMRRIILNMLKQMGVHDCDEAGNGREAIQRITAIPVGLVILQRHLPDMNGVDLARALRSHPATSALRILMVTKNQSREEVLAARQIGVTEWVVVPLNADVLKAKIGAAMRDLRGDTGVVSHAPVGALHG